MPTAADFTAFSVAADSAGGLDGVLPPPPGAGSGPPGATVTPGTVPNPTVVGGLLGTPGVAGPYIHDFEHISIAPVAVP
jgi:hypothetical protein